jgi:serine/threonine-protein kinase
MADEPTEDIQSAEQDRRDRSWLLWLAMAIVLLVIAWLVWDYLSRSTSTTTEAVRIEVTPAQMPAVRPEVDYEVSDGAEDEDESVSTGVPDVVGLMKSDAVGTLQSAGYVASVTTVYSDTKPRGVVFEQVPRAGDAADPGTTVRVLVSGGSQPTATVKVPDLIGLKKSSAVDRIEAAGLDARVLTQFSTSPRGRVFQQSPNPGTSVPRGSKVFVLVSLSR